MLRKAARSRLAEPPTRYVFVSAAKEPWGAERSLSILLRDPENGLAKDSQVLCISERTASFLRAESGVSAEVVEGISGRVSALLSMYKYIRLQPAGACVVIFSLQFLPLIPMVRLLPGVGHRVVADIHDAPRGWVDRLASAFCVRFAHKAISISEYVSKHLWMGSFAITVPRPIDLPAVDFERAPHVGSTIRVGIVGRVDREKRIDLVVRAVGSLADKCDISLHVYGAAHLDAGYPAELSHLARQFGGDFVQFKGVCEPTAIYSELDILVVANENEPSGRTVGEAMMHGVVVVAPDSGGAQEFFESGVSGVTYEAGNEESLASVLSDLAHSREMRERLVSKAKSQILDERAPKSAVGAYARALQSVVAK